MASISFNPPLGPDETALLGHLVNCMQVTELVQRVELVDWARAEGGGWIDKLRPTLDCLRRRGIVEDFAGGLRVTLQPSDHALPQ